MSEAVAWSDDGTPRSVRFDDIYRPSAGGWAQARHVFLQGTGLPQAWAGQPQWRVLETGFGLGLNFLATWHAWREDAERPRLLHFTSIEAWPVGAADLLRAAESHPPLASLARELAAQWMGLTPGLHRLAFEGGRVLLTLCIGSIETVLKELAFQADSVFLDGFDPERNPQMWELGVLKAVARLCRRGAGVGTWTVAGRVRQDLRTCGFVVEKAEGLPPKRHCLRGRYEPAWEVAAAAPGTPPVPTRCVVIGAGLAGAAAAASLARRGWQVAVLEAAATVAGGASALPAGLMAPHQSPDDNPLSRLSRAGVRMTRQAAADLLRHGSDWQGCGALEQRGDDARPPPSLGPALDVWTRVASGEEQRAGLQPPASVAWWHALAAWIKPGQLVRAWLALPGIAVRTDCPVQALRHRDGNWQALDAGGTTLAQAPLLVVAAAPGSASLLADRIRTHPVRGQVSWGLHPVPGEALPAFAVNGNGHFLPRVPLEGGDAWLCGATYGRQESDVTPRATDHATNLARLRGLMPSAAEALAPAFAGQEVLAWTGVRCASSDRKPLVGEIEPGLWVSTALGSRGLTFATLLAELLAARLHGEPLPVEARLVAALDVARQGTAGPAASSAIGRSA